MNCKYFSWYFHFLEHVEHSKRPAPYFALHRNRKGGLGISIFLIGVISLRYKVEYIFAVFFKQKIRSFHAEYFQFKMYAMLVIQILLKEYNNGNRS